MTVEEHAKHTEREESRRLRAYKHRNNMIATHNIQNVAPCEIYAGRHHGPRREFVDDHTLDKRASLVWNILRQDTRKRWNSRRLSKEYRQMGCYKTSLKAVKSMIRAGWASYCYETIIEDVSKKDYDPQMNYGGTEDTVIILHDQPIPRAMRNKYFRRVYGKDFYIMRTPKGIVVSEQVSEGERVAICAEFQGQKGHYKKPKKQSGNKGSQKVATGGGGKNRPTPYPTDKDTQTLNRASKKFTSNRVNKDRQDLFLEFDTLRSRIEDPDCPMVVVAAYETFIVEKIKPLITIPDVQDNWAQQDRLHWTQDSVMGHVFLSLCKPGEEWDAATARRFTTRAHQDKGYITPRQIVTALLNPLPRHLSLKDMQRYDSPEDNGWKAYMEEVDMNKGVCRGQVASTLNSLNIEDPAVSADTLLQISKFQNSSGRVPGGLGYTNGSDLVAWCCHMHKKGRSGEVEAILDKADRQACLKSYMLKTPAAMLLYLRYYLVGLAGTVFPGLPPMIQEHIEFVRVLNMRANSHGLTQVKPVVMG